MFLFLKIRTNKRATGGAKTYYLQVTKEGDRFIMGRPVNPETSLDTSYRKKDGTIVDRYHYIRKEAIAWTESMTEDLKYGNLKTVPQSKVWFNPDPKHGGVEWQAK